MFRYPENWIFCTPYEVGNGKILQLFVNRNDVGLATYLNFASVYPESIDEEIARVLFLPYLLRHLFHDRNTFPAQNVSPVKLQRNLEFLLNLSDDNFLGPRISFCRKGNARRNCSWPRFLHIRRKKRRGKNFLEYYVIYAHLHGNSLAKAKRYMALLLLSLYESLNIYSRYKNVVPEKKK